MTPVHKVPRNAEAAASGVRCGWHGDLDEIPAGFASELAVWAGSGPRACLDAWAAFLRERHRTVRPGRYADELGGKLSYWTDNGAANRGAGCQEGAGTVTLVQ